MTSTLVLAICMMPGSSSPRVFADTFGRAMLSRSSTPKLVVLVHGGTPAPNKPGNSGVSEPNAGTLDYSRFYWAHGFVRTLIGASSTESLKTISDVSLTSARWDSHGPPNSLDKTTYSYGVNEADFRHALIVPGSHTGAGTPATSALLTFRDGSKTLMAQAKDLINQTYEAYVALFGSDQAPISGRVRPDIVFVAHSFGGNVARVALTNPTASLNGMTLTNEERQRADAIRDRTVYLVTLGTPHEGSVLADRAVSLGDAIASIPSTLLAPLDSVTSGAGSSLKKVAVETLKANENMDLRTSLWGDLNRTTLHPDKMRRADGTLIPLYALIGHSPTGSAYYADPNADYPVGGVTLNNLSTEAGRRDYFAAAGLMFVDWLLHSSPKTDAPWGTTSSGSAFDQIAHYHRKNLGLTLSAPGEDDNFPFAYPRFYSGEHVTRQERDIFGNVRTIVVRTNRDGEVDSDGLVSVTSGLGHRLGTATNNFFSNTQEWDQSTGRGRGSWYRISSAGAPWKFHNHQQLIRSAANGTWLRNNLIAVAGPVCGSGSVSAWPVFPIQLTPGSLDPTRR